LKRLATTNDIKVEAKLKTVNDNQAFEIRAIVVDSMYVCRTWLTHKKRWYYFVEHYSFFEVNIEFNNLYVR